MAIVTPAMDFAALTEKAKKIAERRSFLQAQESAIMKQLQDIQSSLVAEYGENYLGLFNDSVALIQQYDQAHASA